VRSLDRNVTTVALAPSPHWCRLSLAFLACGLGCASSTPTPVAPPVRHWVPGYVLGIWGKAELDVRDDCPLTGAAAVRVSATWMTVAVSVLTLGIYTPREVLVQCEAAR